MADFNIRSDSVNVEQIMEQIRSRIREKRGVDYTEQQIRDLAAVKLEKFLDPRGVRSDLLEQFRQAQPAYAPPELPNYAFEDQTLYESTRPPLRWMRKLLNPILKLFFNPNPLIQALNIQARLNNMYSEREARREATRRAFDQLQYELMHNLVIETTRMSIEVKNLKMRVESLASRLEFNERRARALESVVVYKPSPEDQAEARPPAAAAGDARPAQRVEAPPREIDRPAQSGQWRGDQAQPAGASQASPSGQSAGTQSSAGRPPEGPGQRSRRRRRRRGRRGGGSAAAIMSGGGAPQPSQGQAPSAPAAHDENPSADSSARPAGEVSSAPSEQAPSTRAEPDAPSGQGASTRAEPDTPSGQDDSQ